ncbi:acetolactate synthase, small subunit [Sporobacter termitidis DSM 10068]|uniref:acetolactate synthase n=1 Tax=Sporobacter termitidis DSM 10068 TaxID=1123282 RepID=A0A1M5UUN6_9FIRM|nr:ACT domain-containing protein [Sporobacter termitidis]SHH66722.1 acetolactate synthase, small subunit [Sporobacter termitidis DSM 10068]
MNTILRLGVYDSPGVLDRIAGLIRRNGFNITSINAGRSKGGVSQISIVLDDERIDVGKLGQQLVDINFISEYRVLGDDNACIRELALLRMRAADFDAAYFRDAKILERDAREISFELTGAPRDIDALLLPVQDRLLDVVRSGALAISGKGTDANESV